MPRSLRWNIANLLKYETNSAAMKVWFLCQIEFDQNFNPQMQL